MAQMTADVRSRAVRRSSRVAPLIGGAALAAGAAMVTFDDPATGGGRFPGCMFHQVTGLWCPGCGLTRGTHQLLNGHIAAALGENVFTPFVLVAIVLTWLAWARRSVGLAPTPLAVTLGALRDRTWRWSGPAVLFVVVTYGVVRNIPIDPLRSLAP